MAEFLISYRRTTKTEAGYANDPDDHGGETWRGISRNNFPHWKGWQIVDAHRNEISFPNVLGQLPELEQQVLDFYTLNFWNPMRGDEINSQPEADSIYDSAVNMGVKTSIKLAQRSLGIAESGVMDNITLNTLNNRA